MKSTEMQLEDMKVQIELESRQRIATDKCRRMAENEIEELREQIGILERERKKGEEL